LAGILLKTGVYGILRIILNFFPDFSKEIKNIIITLSLFNIIYSPLIATLQKDLKRLIAYSSIGHMGFITIGIFTFEKEGIMGSIFQIFNHGITISALFMIAGAIYKRKKTREIEKLGGLAYKIPILSFIFALFMLSAIGLPGLNNFAGEFLIIYGLFKNNVFVAMISLIGVILTCGYFLSAYRKSIFGEYEGEEIKDLKMNEVLSFIPLIFLIFYLGLYPKIFLENFNEIILWK
jgi:NADH-quinone oxidoreductase subunit M